VLKVTEFGIQSLRDFSIDLTGKGMEMYTCNRFAIWFANYALSLFVTIRSKLLSPSKNIVRFKKKTKKSKQNNKQTMFYSDYN
jgi:hypothetical protein